MPDFLDRYGEQLQVARRRRRRRRAARVSLLVPAAIAVAVFALPRAPDAERPVPPATTSTPVPPATDASAVLAVLRRPQTERDRTVGARRLDGLRLGTFEAGEVRAVTDFDALVPVERDSRRYVCLLTRGGHSCMPLNDLGMQGVPLRSAGRKAARLVGVVPDPVARVRFTPDIGEPVETAVRDNFYALRVIGPGRGVFAWLDRAGNRIGPAR